jgi:glutathione S-transferase
LPVPAETLIHSHDLLDTRRMRIVFAEPNLPYESKRHPGVPAIQDRQRLNPNLRIPVELDDLGPLFDSAWV